MSIQLIIKIVTSLVMKEQRTTKYDSRQNNYPAANLRIQTKALQYQRFDSLRSQTIEGKKVIVETDKKFMESIEGITKNQSSMLTEIIGLKNSLLNDVECEEIHFKAKRHSEANILNIHSNMSKKDVIKEPALKSLYCKCGCERVRGDSYPMCCELENISILGSGILLFFYFLKGIAINVLLFLLIFDIFAMASNLMGEKNIATSATCTSSYCTFRDNVSDGHKYNKDVLGSIQSWLGLAAIIVWILLSRIMKYVGAIKNKEMDKNLTSASDFAIKIGNLPYGEFNEEELVEYFQKLAEIQALEKKNEGNKQIQQQFSQLSMKMNQINKFEGKGQIGDLLGGQLVAEIIQEKELGIKSIQIIYNMEFSRKMVKKIVDYSVEIKQLVEKSNGKYIVQDKQEYHKLKNDLIETYEVFEDLRKKFLSDPRFRKALSTRVAIVEFKEEKDKNVFLQKYGKQALTFFKQIKEKIIDFCFGNNSRIIFKGSIPEIVRAPQPSDIIWENCEKKESVLRILLIYSITFVLIMISLGIMVALEYGQAYITSKAATDPVTNIKVQTAESEYLSTIVNIIVSIVMLIINAVLWVSFSILLEIQYNHTQTNKIISQMTKTSVAMWINIIILPIIVNYFINNRYYGADGLSGIVFDYHISSITVGLIVKLLDPVNLIFKLCISVKCIRNYIIKARYIKRNKNDKIEEEAMKKIYRFYEAPEFNIAEAYTYILSNILHAAFFCSLQPFVLVLALFQAIFFYWICKFKILKFCQIPKMTDKLIFQVALYQFMLVPIFYGVGAIFNSYIANSIDGREFLLLASAICVGIGLLNYFNPRNIVQDFVEFFVIRCACCLEPKKKEQENIEFESQSDLNKKSIRIETYYKSSNSLTLLGFENVILGKTNAAQIETELQTYCESHVLTQSRSQRQMQKQSSQNELQKDTEFKQTHLWTKNDQF